MILSTILTLGQILDKLFLMLDRRLRPHYNYHMQYTYSDITNTFGPDFIAIFC